jgi:hypothetical protein
MRKDTPRKNMYIYTPNNRWRVITTYEKVGKWRVPRIRTYSELYVLA